MVLLLGGMVATEVRHRLKYGHWMGYGWDVDMVSDPAPASFGNVVKMVQFARIRNLTFSTATVQFCVGVDDVYPYELPFAAFRVEASEDGRAWRRLSFKVGLNCGERRQFEEAIHPLESFRSLRGAWGGSDGTKKGDWIRFIVYPSFEERPGIRREFITPPFRLTEEWHLGAKL